MLPVVLCSSVMKFGFPMNQILRQTSPHEKHPSVVKFNHIMVCGFNPFRKICSARRLASLSMHGEKMLCPHCFHELVSNPIELQFCQPCKDDAHKSRHVPYPQAYCGDQTGATLTRVMSPSDMAVLTCRPGPFRCLCCKDLVVLRMAW